MAEERPRTDHLLGLVLLCSCQCSETEGWVAGRTFGSPYKPSSTNTRGSVLKLSEEEDP